MLQTGLNSQLSGSGKGGLGTVVTACPPLAGKGKGEGNGEGKGSGKGSGKGGGKGEVRCEEGGFASGLCQCVKLQGEHQYGRRSVPFNVTEYIRKTWYFQFAQENDFQSAEKLFCSIATYNATLRGEMVPLSQDPNSKPPDLLAFNNCLTNNDQSTPCSTHGRPDFSPSFDSPLCVRKSDSDIPAALRVAPCCLPSYLGGDYFVVAVGGRPDNYKWALISAGQPTERLDENGCSSPTGLWIATRKPFPAKRHLHRARSAARLNGISLSKMLPIDHSNCDYGNNVDFFIK